MATICDLLKCYKLREADW